MQNKNIHTVLRILLNKMLRGLDFLSFIIAINNVMYICLNASEIFATFGQVVDATNYVVDTIGDDDFLTLVFHAQCHA